MERTTGPSHRRACGYPCGTGRCAAVACFRRRCRGSRRVHATSIRDKRTVTLMSTSSGPSGGAVNVHGFKSAPRSRTAYPVRCAGGSARVAGAFEAAGEITRLRAAAAQRIRGARGRVASESMFGDALRAAVSRAVPAQYPRLRRGCNAKPGSGYGVDVTEAPFSPDERQDGATSERRTGGLYVARQRAPLTRPLFAPL